MFGRMKIYTVHIKPGTANPYERPVFVREGFSAFAFLFTFLWALYHRLWILALLVFAWNVALALMSQNHVLSNETIAIVQFATAVIIGFHGNDWRRAKLARGGYILADISAADSLLRAEQRYFERYITGVAHA